MGGRSSIRLRSSTGSRVNRAPPKQSDFVTVSAFESAQIALSRGRDKAISSREGKNRQAEVIAERKKRERVWRFREIPSRSEKTALAETKGRSRCGLQRMCLRGITSLRWIIGSGNQTLEVSSRTLTGG